MIHLKFVRDGEEVLQTDVHAGQRLINVVREQSRNGHLDLPWRCAQGTCGTCLVFLSHAEINPDGMVLTAMERNVLARRGALPVDAPLVQPDRADTPRLACHVMLDHDTIVYFQNS